MDDKKIMELTLKNMYAGRFMTLMARIFGQKYIAIDYTEKSVCITKARKFLGKMYLTDCDLTLKKGFQYELAKDD